MDPFPQHRSPAPTPATVGAPAGSSSKSSDTGGARVGADAEGLNGREDDDVDDEEKQCHAVGSPSYVQSSLSNSKPSSPLLSPSPSSPPSSPPYRAPAVLSPAADVWSLSMVIWEILSGEVPFDSAEFRAMDLDAFVARLKAGLRPQLPREFAPYGWLKDLVSKALDI